MSLDFMVAIRKLAGILNVSGLRGRRQYPNLICT